MNLEHLAEIERRRIVMPPHTMRLNRLERPEQWPPMLRGEVATALARVQWQQYPDYPAFYRRLGEFIGVDPAGIVVGAGIEEFIRSIMILHAGKRVAVLWPTCAMFEIYARAFQVKLLPILTDPHAPLQVKHIVNHCRVMEADCLLLANPGQPVETYFTRSQVAEIAEQLPDVWTVIDEAYNGFGAESALGLPGVTVLRTFSKAFGAAGIRVGYATGKNLQYLNAIRPSGEVGSLSMAVATVLMDQWDIVSHEIDQVIRGRDWLRHTFRCHAREAWGHFGNSVLVEHPDAAGIVKRLAERGVLVRLVTDLDGPGYFMVTCGSLPLMQKFWSEYERVL